MRRADSAERLLALVVEPDKAATIVGDLVETSSLSTGVVLRIAGANLLTQAAARPGSIASMAAGGFLVQLAAAILAGLAFGLGLWRAADWSFFVAGGMYCLTQVAFGVYLAHRARGLEMAVCVALGVIDIFTGIPMGYMALWNTAIIFGILWQRRQDLRHA